MKPKCEDCYYWEHKCSEPEGGQGRKIGTCHRLPVTLDKMDNDWCGEFKLSEKAAEEIISELVKKF